MMNHPSDKASLREALAEFGFDDDQRWMQRLRAAEAHDALRTIGDYELLEEVGRGGQGRVYRAQHKPTGCEVALKVFSSAGFGNAQLPLRREIMAGSSLDHPSILPVIGTDSVEGRLLLLTEWFDGVPITEWAGLEDEEGPRRSQPPQIVRAFAQICDAVAHAHQRGVIHRDLKPTNILINGEGRPVVLDFGIARFVPGLHQSGSSVIFSGALVGTPSYAAPEQVRGERTAIDVRSDVYSLGVTLFETLCGVMPYARSGSLLELLRSIEDEEPRRPSRLNPAVDAELEAIVLKCLAKNPNRRYQSALELKADLENYLHGEPIQATPLTSWSLLVRTLARHRRTTAAVTGFLLLLAAYALSATIMLAQTRSEARKAQRANEFLRETLGTATPYHLGGDVTVLSLLRRAEGRIEDAVGDEPEVEATVRDAIAQAYAGMWLWERAEPHAARSVALQRRIHGSDHPDLASALTLYGRSLAFQRREESIAVLGKALAMRRRMYDHFDPRVAETTVAYAFALMRAAEPPRLEEADSLYAWAIDAYERNLDAPTALWARALYGHAIACWLQERFERSEELFDRATSMYASLGERGDRFYHIHCIESYGDLGFDRRDYDGAREHYEEALSQQPMEHVSDGKAILQWKLAVVAAHAGNGAAALDHYAEALASLAGAASIEDRLDDRRRWRLMFDVTAPDRTQRPYIELMSLIAPLVSPHSNRVLLPVESAEAILPALRNVDRLIS
jgi:serine/threonine-protein kinase